MAVNNSVNPASWLAEQIEHGNPDLLRSMVKTMAETPVSAEADGLCGAEYGRRSDERTRFRTGYFTDGRKLMWEYPRSTPDGEQMDFVEVMEIADGLIQHHRAYWGWFGLRLLQTGHR